MPSLQRHDDGRQQATPHETARIDGRHLRAERLLAGLGLAEIAGPAGRSVNYLRGVEGRAVTTPVAERYRRAIALVSRPGAVGAGDEVSGDSLRAERCELGVDIAELAERLPGATAHTVEALEDGLVALPAARRYRCALGAVLKGQLAAAIAERK